MSTTDISGADEAMKPYLFIGGLVAAGFDPSGAYLLTISHSGRGVYCMQTWDKVARDLEVAYPKEGNGIGIGPIQCQLIPVTEMDFDKGTMQLVSSDGSLILNCESDGIAVQH